LKLHPSGLGVGVVAFQQLPVLKETRKQEKELGTKGYAKPQISPPSWIKIRLKLDETIKSSRIKLRELIRIRDLQKKHSQQKKRSLNSRI